MKYGEQLLQFINSNIIDTTEETKKNIQKKIEKDNLFIKLSSIFLLPLTFSFLKFGIDLSIPASIFLTIPLWIVSIFMSVVMLGIISPIQEQFYQDVDKKIKIKSFQFELLYLLENMINEYHIPLKNDLNIGSIDEKTSLIQGLAASYEQLKVFLKSNEVELSLQLIKNLVPRINRLLEIKDDALYDNTNSIKIDHSYKTYEEMYAEFKINKRGEEKIINDKMKHYL